MRKRLNKGYLFLMWNFEQLAQEYATVAKIGIEDAKEKLEIILTKESY